MAALVLAMCEICFCISTKTRMDHVALIRGQIARQNVFAYAKQQKIYRFYLGIYTCIHSRKLGWDFIQLLTT